jgi:hypothetical protein
LLTVFGIGIKKILSLDKVSREGDGEDVVVGPEVAAAVIPATFYPMIAMAPISELLERVVVFMFHEFVFGGDPFAYIKNDSYVITMLADTSETQSAPSA